MRGGRRSFTNKQSKHTNNETNKNLQILRQTSQRVGRRIFHLMERKNPDKSTTENIMRIQGLTKIQKEIK